MKRFLFWNLLPASFIAFLLWGLCQSKITGFEFFLFWVIANVVGYIEGCRKERG